MTPFSMRTGRISARELAVFNRIRQAVDLLPESHWDCHSVARAVAPLARGFVIVDGYFNRGWEHSWLQSSNCIIDPYPVGGAAPLIATIKGLSPWASLYRPGIIPPEKIEKAVRIVSKLFSGTLSAKGPA